MQLCHLYILANRSRSFLYIGASDDLKEQLAEHGSVSCSSFSADARPVHLIYFENYPRLSLAEARARQLRSWRDHQKWRLIMASNPCLDELLLLGAETALD